MANCSVIYQVHHQLISTKLSDEALSLRTISVRTVLSKLFIAQYLDKFIFGLEKEGKLELFYNYPSRVPCTEMLNKYLLTEQQS